jgi:uncharacterized membrane protein
MHSFHQHLVFEAENFVFGISIFGLLVVMKRQLCVFGWPTEKFSYWSIAPLFY